MTPLQWLDDERLVQDIVLAEAENHVRDLYNQLQVLDGGFELLVFLATKGNSLMTVEDIAYFVKQPFTEVKGSLEAMVGLGLLRRTDIIGLSFFGITADSKRQQSVRDLCAWRTAWRARMDRIQSVIDGKVGPDFHGQADRSSNSLLS